MYVYLQEFPAKTLFQFGVDSRSSVLRTAPVTDPMFTFTGLPQKILSGSPTAPVLFSVPRPALSGSSAPLGRSVSLLLSLSEQHPSFSLTHTHTHIHTHTHTHTHTNTHTTALTAHWKAPSIFSNKHPHCRSHAHPSQPWSQKLAAASLLRIRSGARSSAARCAADESWTWRRGLLLPGLLGAPSPSLLFFNNP